MTSNFQFIAHKIINDSIRNAIYVDDDICEPFDEQIEGDPPTRALCKGVYDSFRHKNCTLDFYKFHNKENAAKNLELFFKRKDLLILDWELTKTQSQSDTLFIIDNAIHTNSLHFICIFTATPIKDYPEIFYNISGYFSGISLEQKDAFNLFIDSFEENGIEFRGLLTALQGKFKELALKPTERGRVFSEIMQEIRSNLGQDYSKFEEFFKRVFPGKFPSAFEKIGYLTNEVYLRETPNSLPELTIFDSQNFIRINHTLILIIGKDEIRPEMDLFVRFTNAILTYQGNFLTLMGLEFRNAFLEQSGFVGKDIDTIDEKALFHHMKNADPSDEFYDFLKELWKTTVFDPISKKNFNIFSILDEYQASQYADEINPGHSDLGKLNFYYNKSPIAKKKGSKISFGDIFRISGEGSFLGQYLICVTPLCDCARPAEKINNMLYFVKGAKDNLADGVSRGDTEYDSYISDDEEIICIKWQPKPFTIFIEENINCISSPMEVIIGETKYTLQYIESIRENYAQRIANHAFSYPLRVGIYFVNKKG